jgi:hypothetical protein
MGLAVAQTGMGMGLAVAQTGMGMGLAVAQTGMGMGLAVAQTGMGMGLAVLTAVAAPLFWIWIVVVIEILTLLEAGGMQPTLGQ